jgi:5-methylcytosine-specific restriction endonuclease McrA
MCRARPSNSVTTATHRRCWDCKQWKPFDAFGLSKDRPGGRDPQCRECGKAYRERNAERDAARAHDYQIKNRKRLNASGRIRKNKWRKANPDKERAQQRRAYAKNGAKYRERAKLYQRGWNKRNKDKLLAMVHRRRARLQGNGGNYTIGEWNALCAFYDHRCLRCGEQKPLTIDHVIPIVRGGRNDILNLQPLCKPCNSSKGTRIIDYRKRGDLKRFFRQATLFELETV